MMLSEFLLRRYIKGYFEESEMKYIFLINIINIHYFVTSFRAASGILTNTSEHFALVQVSFSY